MGRFRRHRHRRHRLISSDTADLGWLSSAQQSREVMLLGFKEKGMPWPSGDIAIPV